MYVGEDGAGIVKPRRGYGTGFTERAKRVAEWKYLKMRELHRADASLSTEELELAADAAYEDYKRESHSREALRIFDETAPVSRSTRPCDAIADVEMAAMRWLGPVRWLNEALGEKTNLRGFAAEKTLPVAMLLQMAFGRGRPEQSSTFASLSEESRPLRAWAHDYPSAERARSTVYESLRSMLEGQDDPEVVTAVNVELIRRLADE